VKYFATICALLFTSCGSTTRVVSEYNASSFAMFQLKDSAIRLLVSSNVDVLDFKQSFKNEYNSKSEFIATFANQLADGFNTLPLISTGNTEDADALLYGLAVNREGVLKNASEKYFIIIRRVEISNKYSTSVHTMPPSTVSTPAGNMPVGGGSSSSISEDCVVTINAGIWSLEDKREVSMFTCTGSSAVMLFRYGTALTNAVENAITGLCDYVKDSMVE